MTGSDYKPAAPTPRAAPEAQGAGRAYRRFRHLPNPLLVATRWARFNLAYPLRGRRPFRPLAMCLYVTYRCNMRCQMCGIWSLAAEQKSGEWSVAELGDILADRLFARLEFVNLNGGEPTLRTDLVDIAALLLDRLPRLANLTLNTNGLPSERCVDNCRRIGDLCRARGVRFGVSVSLHRLGPAFDEVAGVPGAWRKVEQTLRGLKGLRDEGALFLSTNCVLSPLTLAGADEMLQWGETSGVPVNFTVAETRERFNNLSLDDNVAFAEPGDRARLARFLRGLARHRRFVAHHAIRYRELADMVDHGRPRRLACHYALAGVILGWDGTLYYCKQSDALGNVRERGASEIYYDPANLEYRARALLGGACRTCLPNTFNSIELQKDLARLAGLLR